MPIEIGFRDLYIPLVGTAEGESDRAPLSTLDDDERSHVHGTLWIRVDGHDLPALGFFGPDDACLGSWAAELHAAVAALEHADPARHVFDEGEQGQPAFIFERAGASVRISLSASQYDSACEPPPWPSQTCTLAGFVAEVRKFLASLDAVVRAAAPAGEGWLRGQLR